MLTKVAMPDPEAVMRRYPHQLSGGMLQRCVIAMALMTNPSLLIMDEPTTALDVTTQAVVLDLVADLKREFDSAILYITHDLGVITKICDRVGVMYAGEFMEQAELRELFTRPLHPYTLDLLGCVPHFDPTPEKRSLVTIPGAIPRVDELPPGCIFAPRCSFVEEACTAARPPLVEVGAAHLSALPPLADRAAAGRSTCARPPRPCAASRPAPPAPRCSSRPTDAQVHFKAARGLVRDRTAPLIRAVDGVDLAGARRADARRRRRERQRQDHRGARHHRPHAGDRRRASRLHGKPLPRTAGSAAALDAAATSRWCSRTPTRRSTRRAASATRSCGR